MIQEHPADDEAPRPQLRSPLFPSFVSNVRNLDSKEKVHPKRKPSVFDGPRLNIRNDSKPASPGSPTALLQGLKNNTNNTRKDNQGGCAPVLGMKTVNKSNNASINFLTSILRTDMVKVDGADADYVVVQHIIGEYALRCRAAH